MFIQRERNASTTSNKRLLLVLSIVTVLLYSALICSYLEQKYRLDTVEYSHRLLVNELKTILGIETIEAAAAHSSGHHQLERQSHLVCLAAAGKFMSTLDASYAAIELKAYLDQSGRSDYALESAGARIVSIGRTKLTNPQIPWLGLFSASGTAKTYNGPHRVLQPSVYPGECFGFIGRGEIHIKLVKAVYIDAVGIEHILPQMSPDGNIRNAPRQFSVFAIIADTPDANAIHLGSFRYDINKNRPLQLFTVNRNATGQRFDSVRFEFQSNYGADNTCVYRIRVFGAPNPIN